MFKGVQRFRFRKFNCYKVKVLARIQGVTSGATAYNV